MVWGFDILILAIQAANEKEVERAKPILVEHLGVLGRGGKL